VLFDTNALIELIIASQKGEKVKELMQREEASIAIVTLSELTSWAKRVGLDSHEIVKETRETAFVIPVNEEIAEFAGEIHFLNRKEIKDWGMVDSIIYATALVNDLELVTGDSHFKNKPKVVFI